MGFYTAQVLCDLERRAGRPLARSFDLICGTSIGGILALGLSFEVPAERMVQLFEMHSQSIFPRQRRRWRGMLSLLGPVYSDDGLRMAVEDLLSGHKTLGDALHPVIIPTVSLTKGAPQLFKTPHHPRFECDWRRSPVEVALATSAAPILFPLAEIDDNLYADGGLFANSPDLLGIHEAKTFFANIQEADIHVLSIGTTTKAFSLGHTAGRNLGLWGWGKRFRILHVVMSSQQRLVDYMVGHILGDRYVRIDADQSEEQSAELELDRADRPARKTLGGLAAVSMQQAVGDGRLQAFIQHTAQDARFFHGPRKTT